MRQPKIILIAGITFSALAVVVGAFGAHALQDILERHNRIDTFDLGVRYQFYHAFAVIVSGLLYSMKESKAFAYAAVCFSLGILFFSGSLYVLSLTGVRGFGAITPFGGVLFIAGWIVLAIGVWRIRFWETPGP